MLRIGVKTSMWNPWHGCHKFSTGCQHCYVYRTDGKYGKDSSVVAKTEKFNLPVQQKKNKTYNVPFKVAEPLLTKVPKLFLVAVHGLLLKICPLDKKVFVE